MKIIIRKTFILIMFIIFLVTLSSCFNQKNKMNDLEVGYWEPKSPVASYTLEELVELSKEEIENLRNKYIEVEYVVSSNSVMDELYYRVKVVSDSVDYMNTNFRIEAITYQNYWDVPYSKGETVKVEGYVMSVYIADASQYLTIKPSSSIKISPCLVTKK